MAVDKLIDRVMANLKSKRAFDVNIYRDEPILRPASSLKNYLPPAITDLKDYGRRLYFERYVSEDYIFVKQAEKAVDIVDNVDPAPPFFLPCPTYRLLNDAQLRAYFSWRHQWRNGRFFDHPTFILLHSFELIHLIGTSDKEEAFDRLCDLYDRCGEEYVKTALGSLLIDFYVYYQPDRPREQLPMDFSSDERLAALRDPAAVDDDVLYQAIEARSSYRFGQSRFFNAHPALARTAVCNAYRLADAYCREQEPLSLFVYLFGEGVTVFYRMFRKGIFHERLPHPDGTVSLTPMVHYIHRYGAWERQTDYVFLKRSSALGDMMKGVDAVLRRLSYDPHPIKMPLLQEPYASMVHQAAVEAMTPKPTAVTVDLSKLEAIRRAADTTRDRLLVDEEPEEETAPPAAVRHTVLDDAERALVCCLLDGGDAPTLAKQFNRMLSVMCDSINEKCFDTFGDSILDFDGDRPYIIDEYTNDLKGMISL